MRILAICTLLGVLAEATPAAAADVGVKARITLPAHGLQIADAEVSAVPIFGGHLSLELDRRYTIEAGGAYTVVTEDGGDWVYARTGIAWPVIGGDFGWQLQVVALAGYELVFVAGGHSEAPDPIPHHTLGVAVGLDLTGYNANGNGFTIRLLTSFVGTVDSGDSGSGRRDWFCTLDLSLGLAL